MDSTTYLELLDSEHALIDLLTIIHGSEAHTEKVGINQSIKDAIVKLSEIKERIGESDV